MYNVYINNPGHMTKMATSSIYGKNSSKIFFSRTGELISRKLGMNHRWLKYYNVYINHDPVMTLTQFMSKSTWVAIYINHDPVMTLTQFMSKSTWVANAFEWE